MEFPKESSICKDEIELASIPEKEEDMSEYKYVEESDDLDTFSLQLSGNSSDNDSIECTVIYPDSVAGSQVEVLSLQSKYPNPSSNVDEDNSDVECNSLNNDVKDIVKEDIINEDMQDILQENINLITPTSGDESCINTSYRRRRTLSSSDEETESFTKSRKKIRKPVKKLKGEKNIQHLKKQLEKINFKISRRIDLWNDFKKNPDKIIDRLKDVEKKNVVSDEECIEIVRDLEVYHDVLELDENSILSLEERVTRLRTRKERNLEKQVAHKKLFENFKKFRSFKNIWSDEE